MNSFVHVYAECVYIILYAAISCNDFKVKGEGKVIYAFLERKQIVKNNSHDENMSMFSICDRVARVKKVNRKYNIRRSRARKLIIIIIINFSPFEMIPIKWVPRFTTREMKL